MLTYKTYKKIYKNGTFFKYLKYTIWNPIKRILNIPYNIYMCLRYPFLYPRNRFTGLHYNNYKIRNFSSELVNKYKKFLFRENDVNKIEDIKKSSYYFTQTGDVIQYWVNWWAKPLHYFLLTILHDNILQWIFCIPTTNEWNAVEPGWKKAFGKEYLNELKTQLKKDGLLYKFRIMQIKEKWGMFQLYCIYGSNDVYKIIDKYEGLSFDYCIDCGKPAEVISTGWIRPYCKKCAEKHKVHYTDKKIYFNNLS